MRAKLPAAVLLAMLFGTVSTPAGVRSQEKTSPGTFSLSIAPGYFLPIGDWTKHRFAPLVDQFQGGLAFILEVEERAGETIGLALLGGYASLGLKDWESYARSRGDNVHASAYFYVLGAGLRVYVYDRWPDLLNVQASGLYFGSHGQETFNRYSYYYDFFENSSFGFHSAVSYQRFVSRVISIGVTVNALWSSGVKYTDGTEDALFGLLPTLTLRYTFL